MLVKNDNLRGELASELDSIHNYYEGQVIEELHVQLAKKLDNTDYVADIICVALNHLPPRYIRHDVDMVFYLSPTEKQEMAKKIAGVVADAIKFVDRSGAKYD